MFIKQTFRRQFFSSSNHSEDVIKQLINDTNAVIKTVRVEDKLIGFQELFTLLNEKGHLMRGKCQEEKKKKI